MRTTRGRAAVAAVALAALVTAGCGQKAGVSQVYTGAGAVPGTVAGAPGDPALGGVAGDPAFGGDPALGGTGGTGGDFGSGGTGGTGTSGGTGSTGGGTGGTGGSGGDTPPGSTPPNGTPPNGTPPNGAPPASGPVDRTGVTDTTIKIGVHAPVTGAAAFPQASFERSVGVYADYINKKGGIHGRKIEIVFRDDRFDPNSARTVCKEMAEQEKVFLLIGGGGADQIDACARYAAALGVPYLSAGVHETRPGLGSLASLPTYFALSLTYEQQVPLLARLVATDFKGQKAAVIVADNDSLNNFYGLADAAVKKAIGSDLVLSRRIPKKTDVDAPSIGTQICNSGAKVVLWNASPSGLINVSKAMTCQVTFVGPGLTAGLNIVATTGCPNVAGARFYSPFPGLDKIDQMDPNFRPAYRAKAGAEPDDIGVAVWGLEKLVGQILDATGKDLSRQSFMATIGRVKAFNNGVYPATDFSRSRFGGTAMHLLQADCSSRQYRTIRVSERP